MSALKVMGPPRVSLCVNRTLELSTGSRNDRETADVEEAVEVVIVVLTDPSAPARSSIEVMCSELGTDSRETVCQIPEQGYIAR